MPDLSQREAAQVWFNLALDSRYPNLTIFAVKSAFCGQTLFSLLGLVLTRRAGRAFAGSCCKPAAAEPGDEVD